MRLIFTLTFPFLVTAALFASADETVEKLSPMVVRETALMADKYLLSQVTAGVTARQAAQKINAVDAEDVVKYLPSIFLRKRNYGDTQAVMASRVWGVSSSARSLVYADGVLLSALIANNNTIGAPRWGLVSSVSRYEDTGDFWRCQRNGAAGQCYRQATPQYTAVARGVSTLVPSQFPLDVNRRRPVQQHAVLDTR